MKSGDLKGRTKQFALRMINLTEALPRTRTGDVIGRQLLRSGTSVGANYRSACRARSKPDFISKIGISIEEADESLHWMELIVEAKLMSESRLCGIMKEADELIAILTASSKTAQRTLRNQQSKIRNEYDAIT